MGVADGCLQDGQGPFCGRVPAAKGDDLWILA